MEEVGGRIQRRMMRVIQLKRRTSEPSSGHLLLGCLHLHHSRLTPSGKNNAVIVPVLDHGSLCYASCLVRPLLCVEDAAAFFPLPKRYKLLISF